MPLNFASDNTAPVAPQVLEALTAANSGPAMPYGTDPLTAAVEARLREIFEAPKARVYLVGTGTAANALSLACLTPPWAGVFCHRNAHIEEDECGAPEFFIGGSKMVLVGGDHARMDPDELRAIIAHTARAGVHNIQRGAVSLSNSTEAGAVYTPDQVARICDVARDFGLPVHMDGARFANAVVATGASPADLTWRAGVDVLSFGATKNGCLGVEAVILFDPERAAEFELRRKRGGHLFSKHRYLAAQMQAYLEGDLWLGLAGQANAMAARLASGLKAVAGARLDHPAEANAVFAALPRAAHVRAHEGGAQYYMWPFDQSLEGPGEDLLSARLLCSWSTRAEDVDALLALFRG
ncbi:threonine aldolase family protein [Phaeovulum vinaykumarii]|uniref:L-threonine aldolase n=1 Tax=Phaeovulum vinaykumarii TaxID=407234 RepID=A0A1N7JMU1_9RHOB|nr:low specificity L-threonine aldolase [Phaeovulum vinaykumarii]SIS50683.1 L-threonine aldolase [Phaeovulum vinaykumarii]SOB90372.1 L-threonine aldolase [Phaeovulum vinaykumarii]